MQTETLSPIHQAAQRSSAAVAYRFMGQSVSYSALSQGVIALAEQLSAMGLKRGDRLACIAHNSPQLLQLYWACVDSGIIFCPVSPRFATQQVIELMQTHSYHHYWLAADNPADSTLIQALNHQNQFEAVTLDFTRQSQQPAPALEPHTAVNAILTSGSSGTPKAAAHSLANHIASAAGSSELIKLTKDDSWLLSLPLFHIGGLAILNRCALAGACVVFEDKSLSLAEQLIRDRVSHLSLVSAQLQQLLNADGENEGQSDCLSQVKAMLLGGGAISADLLAELAKHKIKAFTSYGMTEMGSQITTGIARTDGSSGKLLSGRELKIIDGEIWVKGECLFLGYLTADGFNLPLDKDGWFYTKDLGHFDENGNLCIDGRADNMFISGGENIQPEEIETALKLHPLISDAIVFPVADAKFGNLPAAILKLVSGTSNDQEQLPSEAELTEFLAIKIARFKRPRSYYPWPEVSSAGIKVIRKQVIAAVKR
ncbi:o-succinylbenzoate--CoA ligase [Shewanella schlegeliana]|nr:o-succinylbenzoate--CoA ligase [Shewanella schlegeliana]MCL1109576.1 o-succinylbenzoate--CoA ligase [Shewanella schlegeliana]